MQSPRKPPEENGVSGLTGVTKAPKLGAGSSCEGVSERLPAVLDDELADPKGERDEADAFGHRD